MLYPAKRLYIYATNTSRFYSCTAGASPIRCEKRSLTYCTITLTCSSRTQKLSLRRCESRHLKLACNFTPTFTTSNKFPLQVILELYPSMKKAEGIQRDNFSLTFDLYILCYIKAKKPYMAQSFLKIDRPILSSNMGP